MKFVKQLLIMIAVLMFQSCVEEYWPELNEVHDRTLVVDGRISNEPGPYIVKLSQSISFQDSVMQAEVGANVFIEDQNGNTEQLIETEPGVYKTNASFQAIIGTSYRLNVITAGQREIRSEFEEIKAVLGIESVDHYEASEIIDATTAAAIEGFQFTVTSELSDDPKTFLYYDLIETYEYRSDYPIQWYYNGTPDYTNTYFFNTQLATPFHATLYDCWSTDTVREFYTVSTENFSEPKINEHPLHFIEFADDRLKHGYSVEVKQYSVTESAHKFLQSLHDQNTDQDQFYTSLPYQVQGNLSNVNDSTDVILGYFMAAGISESKRVFAKRPKGKIPDPPFWIITCGNYIYQPNRLTHFVNSSTEEHWPMYFAMITIENPTAIGGLELMTVFSFLSRSCVDCRVHGGVTQKPDFWIDQ